jgi:hypothetical protein
MPFGSAWPHFQQVASVARTEDPQLPQVRQLSEFGAPQDVQ